MKPILTFFTLLLLIGGGEIEANPSTDVDAAQPRAARGLKRVVSVGQALVIGNDQYQQSPLMNPVNDAIDMARVLSEIGFDVTLKTNLNQQAMDEAIYDFGRRLSASQGVGLFFFAGHGARVEGENYLLPIDNNQIREDSDLRYRAVSADQVWEKMEKAKTTLNIIILDACRNNPYRGMRSLNKGLARMVPVNDKNGSIIMFATAAGKTASDLSRNGRNGLFTSHLLSALKTAHQTHQRIDDMFVQVRNAVKEESGGEQEPWYSVSWRKQFCFGGCQTSPSGEELSRLKAEVSALKAHLQALMTSSNDDMFRDRLNDGGLGPEMMWIRAGSFRMGDLQNGGDRDEKPNHRVSLSRFAVGRYEVTFAEYDKFAKATGREKPSDEGWGRGKRPVVNVSFQDATAYAKWLIQQTGKQYRLPTEAEWEYAARAGTETKYWWGNNIGRNKANCRRNHCGDRFEYTAHVGSFVQNPFGLYDTVGNVWEWTCSKYENKYNGEERRCSNKNNVNMLFVVRGGSWYDDAKGSRSAYRNRYQPAVRYRGGGFRVIRR